MIPLFYMATNLIIWVVLVKENIVILYMFKRWHIGHINPKFAIFRPPMPSL